MTFSVRKYLPHIFVLAGFAIVALLYFSPVLSGKKLYQSDIVQYIGMAKEQIDFRADTGEEPYWTDSAYGGMPTYQLGAKYPHNYIKKLDLLIRFLPRPADYLFLYFIGFYIFLLTLKVNWRYAALGSLAFGFSTYLIVIIGVGHNAKAHAVAYMPLVLSGIVLVFRRYYIWGFILTAIALALEIVANHYQMTYYLMLLVGVMGVAFLIDAYRSKTLNHFFKSIGVLLGAVIIAIGLNATNLLATKEYADFSTRSSSEITINPDGSPKAQTSGLDKDYINLWSYGKLETLNLYVARIFGGSNDEPYDKNSEVAQFLKENQVPIGQREEIFQQYGLYYWGDQPGVSGPAYIGAVVIFLFILALFVVKGRIKWWLVGGAVLTLLLSYGKNLAWFTDLWIDYVPLYNKFRAVTSIQVITELCVPALGIIGLYAFMTSKETEGERLKTLMKASGVALGILVLLLLGAGVWDFVGVNDRAFIEQLGLDFVTAMRDDRKNLYIQDVVKNIVLIGIASLSLWAYVKNKVKEPAVLVVFALLIMGDLIHIDRHYVNDDNFVSARVMDDPFASRKTKADAEILRDKGRFRVYEERTGISSSRSSYFHKSIGGYHGAVPKRMQDIADFYLYKGKIAPLNMLNVRYVIREGEREAYAQRNPEALGNAWFPEKVRMVPDANAELLSLDDLDFKQEAVVHTSFNDMITKKQFVTDSTASIRLVHEQPNHLSYEFTAREDRMTVFSEVYFESGWNAYVDEVLTPHFRTNYMLRGMIIPAGNHKVEFKFEPTVVTTGSSITLASSILLGLLLLGGIAYSRKDLNTHDQA